MLRHWCLVQIFSKEFLHAFPECLWGLQCRKILAIATAVHMVYHISLLKHTKKPTIFYHYVKNTSN